MGKGLPRSLANAGIGAEAGASGYVTKSIAINQNVNVVATGAANGIGTLALGGLGIPEANVIFEGIVANLQFVSADANIADGWGGSFGVGTAANADATLTGTDVDVLASQTLAATGSTEPTTRYTNITRSLFDNTAGAGAVNLNVLVNAANITDDTTGVLTISGDIHIAYLKLGDD